jgi:hypothetical protein
MSTETPPPEAPAEAGPPTGTMLCARCGHEVPPEADWCLECGLAARTRIAPTPRWRIPLVGALVVSVLALAGLGYAFVELTRDPAEQPPAATAPAPAPEAQPEPVPDPAAPGPAPGEEPPTITIPADPETGDPGGAPAPGEPPTATAPAAPPAPGS